MSVTSGYSNCHRNRAIIVPSIGERLSGKVVDTIGQAKVLYVMGD